MIAADPILAEIARRLVDALRPERIYLFGSRARGDAAPDSDDDIVAVVPESDLAPHRRDLAAFRALCGVGVSKDVIAGVPYSARLISGPGPSARRGASGGAARARRPGP